MWGPLEEQVGSVTVGDRVCLDVGWLPVLSSVISLSLPRLRKLSEWISGIWVPSRQSVFRHIRGVQRKPLPAFVVFQAPTVQSSRHRRAAWIGVTGPELLASCLGDRLCSFQHHEVEEADFWAKLRPLIHRCRRARACLQSRVCWCGEATPGAPLATTRRQDPAPALVAGTGGKPLGLSSSCCWITNLELQAAELFVR